MFLTFIYTVCSIKCSYDRLFVGAQLKIFPVPTFLVIPIFLDGKNFILNIESIVSSKLIQIVKTVFISSIIISYYSGFFLQKPVFVLIETIS